MRPPIYDEVHNLALAIVNASELDDDDLGAVAYKTLIDLCITHENTELNHPLQWEALGDFSESHNEAIQAYEKGLNCSNKLGLSEYSASIKLAMAESYFDQQNLVEAQRLALEANIEASVINNIELKASINEFLNMVRHT